MSTIAPCNAAVFLFSPETVKEFAMYRMIFSMFYLTMAGADRSSGTR
jgi:hypothetical protein